MQKKNSDYDGTKEPNASKSGLRGVWKVEVVGSLLKHKQRDAKVQNYLLGYPNSNILVIIRN